MQLMSAFTLLCLLATLIARLAVAKQDECFGAPVSVQSQRISVLPLIKR